LRLAREALDMVQMAGREKSYPRELSGGQQQRVAIARSIAARPTVWLLDEPLSALDRKLRVEMQSELRSLQKLLGITTIYVTHDQEEALAMSDEIAIFRDGLIAQQGAPRQLYDAPVSTFVADFLGSANLLDGIALGGAAPQINIEGAHFPLEHGSNVATGTKVRLSVRPERLRLHASRKAADQDGLSTVVESVVYLGSDLRLVLRTSGGARLVARTSSHGELAQIDIGSNVYANWNPGEAVVVAT
jgi:ABC-type Fe3+/spermidine/putrescine transport system ATPase subunit